MSDFGIAHRHQWKVRERIDRCHYIEVRRSCECGAWGVVPERRDFSDPLTPAFLDRNCEVCVTEAEVAGISPEVWRVSPHAES